MVHSFFTFYLNLVRKAFNISSVIRRCGNRASAIHSFCWTKALLKGRLLVGFGWTSESFVDFDSFILLWRIPEDKLFDSLWREHVSSPWRGIGPSFLGNIFWDPWLRLGRELEKGFSTCWQVTLIGDQKTKVSPFRNLATGRLKIAQKEGPLGRLLGALLAFWCFCFCRIWIDHLRPGWTTVIRDRPPPAFDGFKALYRCSHGGAV